MRSSDTIAPISVFRCATDQTSRLWPQFICAETVKSLELVHCFSGGVSYQLTVSTLLPAA